MWIVTWQGMPMSVCSQVFAPCDSRPLTNNQPCFDEFEKWTWIRAVAKSMFSVLQVGRGRLNRCNQSGGPHFKNIPPLKGKLSTRNDFLCR
jgi:hypothetical protein